MGIAAAEPSEPNINDGDPNGVVDVVGYLEPEGAPNGLLFWGLVEGFEVDGLLKMPFVWDVAPNGFEGAPKTPKEAFWEVSGGEVTDGLPNGFVLVGGWNGCEGAPNGLEAGLSVRNGLLATSVFAGAKGVRDVVVAAPKGDELGVDAKGFIVVGEGDLLRLPFLLLGGRGSANRTDLLLKVPRWVPLPLPFTVVPFCPRCSRFKFSSSRSCSKGLGGFSVGEVPEYLWLEQLRLTLGLELKLGLGFLPRKLWKLPRWPPRTS